MHIQTDRALIPAATSSVRYLQVLISAPPAPASTTAPRAPAAVAFVLDRSGSMDGSKIAMARKAVQHAIRLLAPHDSMALVCYDDRVETVLARTPASAEAKTLVLSRLAQIDARGSTDLSGGWLKGADELLGIPGAGGTPGVDGTAGTDGSTRADSTNANVTGAAGGVKRTMPADAPKAQKRVLLLTDGLANQGMVDPQELAATAARLRAQGVTTSTFGVGADFDEELLSRLATQGGGNFYFIEQAGQIPDFFASELSEALEVVARDAVFEIACSAGVDAALVNDMPTDAVTGELRVRLGDLVADQEMTLIVALRVKEPPPLGDGIEVRCRLADRDHVLFAQPLPVDWAVVSPAENDAQPVNQTVVLAVATLMAERARGQALAANRRGAFDDAQRILHAVARELRVLGGGSLAVEAVIAQLQRDQGDYAEAMSPVQMKQRHFASYAMQKSRTSDGQARRGRSAGS